MHASIRRYRVDSAKRDEAVRRVDDVWTDELRKEKDAFSYYVVAAGSDELISFTSATTEEALAAIVEKSTEWVGRYLQDLDITFLEEHRGPVVSHLG